MPIKTTQNINEKILFGNVNVDLKFMNKILVYLY